MLTLKSFPPPLTSEEEVFYMNQYMNGNINAKNILIEHNLRLVAHVMKRYQHLEDDMEDLISIGTIGLIKAISTFDPSKKAKLATYACRCIENEILMMLRGKKKYNREFSIYDSIGTDPEGNEIQLYDILESNDLDVCSQIGLKDDITLLYKLIETELSSRERFIIVLRYGLFSHREHTQKEIANTLHISRSYVSRIEKSALEKLRPFFSI